MSKGSTKYPIVLVHGIGFRDRKHFGYWGRIPSALEEAGAVIFFGNQDSWGTTEGNAAILKASIEQALEKSGAEKVNLIAHSKGGLEARYVISSLGMGEKIASLTTIATPHRGSKTMGVLCNMPDLLFRVAAVFVNLWFRLLGDKNPDFAQVCKQLSPKHMEEFNQSNPDHPGVFYQSYTALMKRSTSDFVLCFPHFVVSAIEGENDGLVTPESARWGSFRGIWRGVGNRGISHADEVDARRRNLSKATDADGIFDIRKEYLTLTEELKQGGY